MSFRHFRLALALALYARRRRGVLQSGKERRLCFRLMRKFLAMADHAETMPILSATTPTACRPYGGSATLRDKKAWTPRSGAPDPAC